MPFQDTTTAQHAAVDCAVRALGADFAVLLLDGAVVAAIGVDPALVPLADIALGRRGTVLLGRQQHSVTYAEMVGGVLVLGRAGPAFGTEDVALLRGMARVLELGAQPELDNARLAYELHRIQRAIARRVPLQQILDAVTGAAAELIGVEVATLSLVEKDAPTLNGTGSSRGLPADVLTALRRVPLTQAGTAGQAVLGNRLVAVDDYQRSPVANALVARSGLRSVMSVPVHEDGSVIGALSVGSLDQPRHWDASARAMLTAFAEHVSLALTEARTFGSAQHGSHDALTGLPGRALFISRMEAALSAVTAGVGVLFVDVDRFKVVNDSLGHAAGDELLRQVAVRIGRCLRKGDTAARLGGDEFAVLVPDVADTDQLVPVARRLLQALREPFLLDGQETFVSSSIGIAYSPAGNAGEPDLMVRADLAMYQAKKHGKDRYQVFEPAMQEEFRAALQLEADLRRAVVRNEFVLRFQPIVHLRTGEISGLEALVRWEHPERGTIAPLDFIPLAEETGLIVPIGEWVLREACRQVAAWNERRPGRPLSVSVNLSAVQLDRNTLPEVVAAALADTGLPPACLVIELTESLLVDHRSTTLTQLQQVKAMGVRLAIDDFGTGYSSLAYLRRFPVDIIKIDKSFVDDVSLEPAAAALALGIIQLGHALKLSTVAEGIEDAGQLTELTDGNCELGQGYFFAQPLTGDAFTDLLFPHPPADAS